MTETEATVAAAPAEAEPALKKQKVEETEPHGEPATDGVPTQGSAADTVQPTPVQLGYKTFQDGDEAYQYFSYLLNKLTHNQDINEYEHHCLLALLEKGHANAAEKIGSGVRAFQVRPYADDKSVRCFYVCRTDGTVVDFSFRKCLVNVFPTIKLPTVKKPAPGRGGRGGGRGRGRGRGGRK